MLLKNGDSGIQIKYLQHCVDGRRGNYYGIKLRCNTVRTASIKYSSLNI